MGDPGDDIDRQRDFNNLVLGGKVCYLNAYPRVEGRRSLPTLLSMRHQKDKQDNSSKIDLCAFDDEDWPEDELSAIGEGFLTIGLAKPQLFNPDISSRVHQQRDREKGRAWKDEAGKTHGAIFTFESLDANQEFEGLIQMHGESDDELNDIEEQIKDLLKEGEKLLFGRSRRKSYGGLASVSWSDHRSSEVVGGAREGLRPLSNDIVQNERFRVLLTSPAIVRNQRTGQIDPAFLEEAIVRLLHQKARKIRTLWSFDVIGGFNRKWRLSLPQAMAVSAGSVIVLEAEEALSIDDLKKIEHKGIGERKTEGFGRILFLDMPQRYISLPKFIESPHNTTVDDDPGGLVLDIEKRIVQGQIERKIEEQAAMLAQSAANLPNNSLIGRLRTQLRGPDHMKSLDTLTIWLDGNDEQQLKQPAMDQLRECKVNPGKDLRSWILSVMDRDTLFELLKVDVCLQRYYLVSVESATNGVVNKSQAFSVKLIDAVLSSMMIRNKLKEAGNG